MSKILILFIPVIAMFAVVSCMSDNQPSPSPTPSIQPATPTNLPPRLIFPDQQVNCEASNCWNGITPGLTTLNDALALLESQFGQTSITTNQRYSVAWEVISTKGTFYSSARVYQDEMVDSITVYLPDDLLTVSELIERIGEPSFVYVARAFSSEALCAGAFLAYPELGIHPYLFPIDDSAIGVTPSQAIAGLDFLNLEYAAEFTITDHFVLRWQGYADYCDVASLAPSP